MDEFRVTTTIKDGIATVSVEGELDAATAPALDERVRMLAADGVAPASVVVNLAGVGFIDSSGLSVLVATHKRLRREGGDLVVEGATPSARRLFAIAGLDTVLTVR